MKKEKKVLDERDVLYDRISKLSSYLGDSRDFGKEDESTLIKEIFVKLVNIDDRLSYICQEVRKIK